MFVNTQRELGNPLLFYECRLTPATQGVAHVLPKVDKKSVIANAKSHFLKYKHFGKATKKQPKIMVGEKIIHYYCYLRGKDSINALGDVSNYPRTYLNGVYATAPAFSLVAP